MLPLTKLSNYIYKQSNEEDYLQLPQINNLGEGLVINKYLGTPYFTARCGTREMTFMIRFGIGNQQICGSYFIDHKTKLIVKFELIRKTSLEHFKIRNNMFSIGVYDHKYDGHYYPDSDRIIISKPLTNYSVFRNLKLIMNQKNLDAHAHLFVYNNKRLTITIYINNAKRLRIITKYKHQRPFKTIIRCDKKQYIKYL